MNKRPHPGGLGLPAKPYSAGGPPGPAPPLPAGPPPGQQYPQDQGAAHAAAWAAYYQAQGQGGAGYTAPAQPAATNAYANYGYGAGAQHSAQATPPAAPAAQPYQQPQQYGGYQQPQQAYQQPPTPQQQPQYQYNQYGAGYASPTTGHWAGQASPPPAAGYNAHTPKTPNPTAGGYTPQANQNQPYFPPGNQPYRPGNRPYQPQPNRGGPARPPTGPSGPGGPGPGFPPAKRPRFDSGPGNGPGGGGVPPRPPPPRGGFSGQARPMGDRTPSGPRNGPPMNNIPRIGFGNNPRGGMRGGHGGGGGRGGAPMRGGMMRQPPRQREMRPPQQRRVEPPRAERKRKDKDKEAKTTMTDFRIVGIEVKGLEWSWGMVGEHVFDKDEEEEVKEEAKSAEAAEVKEEAKEDDKPGVKEEAKDDTKAEVKDEGEAEDAPEPVKEEKDAEAKPVAAEATEAESEAQDATETEANDEKRGEKRKAKPSSVDGENPESPKKRTFVLTHNKVNPPSGPSPESNQNRFRIYFESPPELDRVPKASRRNPNKRWRRESSSVAPSRAGDVPEEEEEEHHEAEEAPAETENQKDEITTVTTDGAAVPTETVNGDASHDAPEPVEPATEAESTAEEKAAPSEAAPEPAAAEETTTAASETAADGPAGDAAPPPTEESTEAAEQPAREAEASTEAAENAGDISMVTDPGTIETAVADVAEPSAEATTEHSGLTGTEASAAELEVAIAESAQNAASAYGSRQKQRSRRWSTSSLGSEAESVDPTAVDASQPSLNRVSVLYEDSTRRLVFDASVVHKIRIFRGEGRIEVDLLASPKTQPEGDNVAELPKGVLIETYDAAEQRFVAVTRERLNELHEGEADKTLPPLHRAFASGEPITLTVFLNKKKPLSEPKWCRTNQADEWLWEQFGSRGSADGGWRGKLEIMDPDAPPTLATILDGWKNGSSAGTPADRVDFTTSLLAEPNDLLEILLRLTRGERNAPVAGVRPTSSGPLATAIRPDSPYASHQTHVSLAILAMYRLTTDYAEQAGVKTEVLNDKIADIIRSLPSQMIHRSLDGLYKEWLAERKA